MQSTQTIQVSIFHYEKESRKTFRTRVLVHIQLEKN